MGKIEDVLFSRTMFEELLAWRWHNICECLEECETLPHDLPKSDPRILAARRFCLDLDCSEWPPPPTTSDAILGSAIGRAWRLWQDPSQARMRTLVEALLYADLPADEIADRLRLIPEVVDWFEFLFFDIRPLLDDPEFFEAWDAMEDCPAKGREAITPEDIRLKRIALTLGADALLKEVSDSDEDGPGD
ncbi:MAG: hypothetical protein HZA51_12295 [Planctomycetes bacterium]|nr:hypothetical protein [Planctomycetota bacterium]